MSKKTSIVPDSKFLVAEDYYTIVLPIERDGITRFFVLMTTAEIKSRLGVDSRYTGTFRAYENGTNPIQRTFEISKYIYDLQDEQTENMFMAM